MKHSSPKHVAENVLKSWLRAVRIEVGEDLTVGTLQVSVVRDDDELREGVSLWAVDLGSSDMPRALESFHVLTEIVGAGKPVPVDRGIAPTRSEMHNQDLFLVAVRHREFRSSPDLSYEQAKHYGSAVRHWADSFYRRNQDICEINRYECEDLETFAWVWAHVHAHKSAVADPGRNLRLFWNFMKQRGAELRRYLINKMRAVAPDPDTAGYAFTGEAERLDEEDSNSRHEHSGDAAPRAEMASKLRARLAEMPHDAMVRALTEAAHSKSNDFATQRAAGKLLREHSRTCPECRGHQGRHEQAA